MSQAVIEIDGDKFMAAMDLQDKSLQAARKEISFIMDANWEGAWQSFLLQRRDAAAAGDAKLRFKISVGVVMEPMGRNCVKVSAKLAYGTKHDDETIGTTVSNQPELPLEDRPETAALDDIAEELMTQAEAYIREIGRASTSSLQRKFRIGYTTAASIMDALERNGIVGPPRGTDSREILPLNAG